MSGDDTIRDEEATLLPDREAMSIVSPGDPTEMLGGYTEVGATGEAAAQDASGQATSAPAADASSSGGESVTSEDRSEQISASDSATAVS